MNKKRKLVIKNIEGVFTYDFDKIRVSLYEVQRDGNIAYVVYLCEGGRYVYSNESLTIQLIED